MEIKIVVACDMYGLIGVNGAIPWHIPEDLRRFKELTTGHAVIMGRKTWESLPVKPLPKRANIVVTRTADIETIATAARIEHALWIAKEPFQCKAAFIIGGERLYREALPLCDEVYLTRVHQVVEHGPDDEVARFDDLWFMSGWDKCSGWSEEILGKTADGPATFYKFTRIK